MPPSKTPLYPDGKEAEPKHQIPSFIILVPTHSEHKGIGQGRVIKQRGIPFHEWAPPVFSHIFSFSALQELHVSDGAGSLALPEKRAILNSQSGFSFKHMRHFFLRSIAQALKKERKRGTSNPPLPPLDFSESNPVNSGKPKLEGKEKGGDPSNHGLFPSCPGFPDAQIKTHKRARDYREEFPVGVSTARPLVGSLPRRSQRQRNSNHKISYMSNRA